MLVISTVVATGVAAIGLLGVYSYKERMKLDRSIPESVDTACCAVAVASAVSVTLGACAHGDARVALVWVGSLSLAGALLVGSVRTNSHPKLLQNVREQKVEPTRQPDYIYKPPTHHLKK